MLYGLSEGFDPQLFRGRHCQGQVEDLGSGLKRRLGIRQAQFSKSAQCHRQGPGYLRQLAEFCPGSDRDELGVKVVPNQLVQAPLKQVDLAVGSHEIEQ